MIPATFASCLLVGLPQPSLALTILSVRKFSQSVGLSSSFSRSTSSAAENATVSQHEFTEDYGTFFEYSILGPRLWQGDAMLDLEWLQYGNNDGERTSSRSSTQLHYNIDGRILSSSPYPLSFSTSSSRQTISQSFAPSYDSQSDFLNLRFSMLNKIVPSEVTFYKLTQQNSGGGQNLEQTTRTISFSARPSLGDYGSLAMDTSLTDGETSSGLGAQSASSSASAHAGYQNAWKSRENLTRNLAVSCGYQQDKGSTLMSHQNVNGSLSWDFGKVLHGDLNGFYSKTSGAVQEVQDMGVSGILTHRLLSTITTTLRGAASTSSFAEGENRFLGGTLGLNYNKRLPEASEVAVGYFYSANRMERTGDVALLQVFREQYAIPGPLPRRITINQPTFQAAGLSVMGVQSQLQYPASFFRVVPEGIELLDFYPGDTDVLISYDYLQDPGVTTLALSQSVSATLNLKNNTYALHANASFSDPKVLKGDASSLSTSGSSHYAFGANARLARHTLASELGRDKDYAHDQFYFSNNWGYNTTFARGDLGFSANDRLTWDGSSEEGEKNPWINAFSIQSSYRRNIGMLSGKFKADYSNSLVQGGDMSHTAVVSANLEGKFGKVSALLNASAGWNFSGGGNSSTQSIGVSMRRSF